MTQTKVSGEDLIFLIEAIFAVSSGLGTLESRKAFLSSESKVKKLAEVQAKYSPELIAHTLEQLKETVFKREE